MFDLLSGILIEHPELALFLALGLGYAIGKIRYRTFTIGAVTGCLIAGVLIGQTGVVMSNDVKQAFFLLFLFAIGYRTGPQFFRSLNAKALPQIAVTVILCVVALAVVLGASLIFNLGIGTASGLLAGATTESAAVGVALDTFRKSGADATMVQAFEADVATSFAVAYLAGVIATILMASQIAPRFLRRSLAEACAELEAGMNASEDGATSAQSARRSIEARAYLVDPTWVGMTISQAEARVPQDAKAYVEQVRRKVDILPANPDLRLEAGDIVAVVGLREFLVARSVAIGTEIDDAALLDVPAESADVVVTKRGVIGQSLFELKRRPEARTVFLRKLLRSGEEMPIYGVLTLERGDVLTLVGSKRHVEDAAKMIGYADRPTTATDMVFVGVFIFLGGLIGLPTLHLGALELGLGIAVGTLIGGLIAGWLRARYRTFGFVPAATLWLFDSVGLSAFIACVGISAGPGFVTGLVSTGPLLVLITIAVVVLSHGTAIFVGRRVFDMNEGVLLGTCCGAGTSAPALAAVQDVAQSRIPTLGYGLGYAIGNILLALWGAVLVTILEQSM
ncbi:aspartate-alanine antiporter [Aestuariivirga sp.]|uniref:aspartate-alanine antiporter n=1 Tax=Aestuariivirga sp. TaxID=2650926 RepID=UPI003592ECC1